MYIYILLIYLGFYEINEEKVMEKDIEFRSKTLEQLEGTRRDVIECIYIYIIFAYIICVYIICVCMCMNICIL